MEPAPADRLFAALRARAQWSQEHLQIFGKRVAFPRLTAWYGDAGTSYKYSGVRYDPLPWLPELRELRASLERQTGTRFNSVLLNWYRDGNDSMGWHADNERELGAEPVIASLSLGAERRFDLKHRDGAVVHVGLTHGSLLVMAGALQHAWVHRVPKQPRITGGRINLTFRITGAGSA
jgi:alkylated DNA repair dioxygenase AlkB